MPQKKPEKSTKAQVEHRVSTVYQWLLEGVTNSQIVQKAAEQWGIKERQARDYIAKACDRIKSENTELRQEALLMHLAWRRDLYRKSIKANQLAVALGCLKDEAELLGIYPEKGAIASPPGQVVIMLPDNGRESEIKQQ